MDTDELIVPYGLNSHIAPVWHKLLGEYLANLVGFSTSKYSLSEMLNISAQQSLLNLVLLPQSVCS